MSKAGPKGQQFQELVEVMARLLGDNGCPWDREQTLDSLLPYLLEETYEVVEALEHGSPEEHRDELGDLLLQIVFQAALRDRDGAFDIDDVSRGIVEKLVRRHPHVFADSDAATASDVENQWEAIKEQEKAARGASGRTLDGVPRALPALVRAQKISSRAARVGFDWPDVAGCEAKVREELAEIAQAKENQPESVSEEVGDLLFAAVSLARKLGVDAETALRQATSKFETRFGAVEDRLAADGRKPGDADLSELDSLWNAVKSAP